MVDINKIIRKFPHCNYHINQPIRTIEDYLNHFSDRDFYKLELCPDFQRGHVWTTQQQINYVEYLLKEPMQGCGTVILFNCPGWQCNHISKNCDLEPRTV